MNLQPQYVDFLGTPTQIVDLGTLTTERDGLRSITSIYKIQRGLWNFLPQRKSKHPIFENMTVDRAEINFSGPFAIANCTYFGIETEESDPVYDITDNTSEEPIATHPDFAKIAGDATNPMNGAVFRKAGMAGEGAYVSEKTPPADLPPNDKGYVFDRFEIKDKAGKINQIGGTQSYLEPGITYRKSWVRRHPLEDISAVGKIMTPVGTPPQLDEGRNWLCISITEQIKGACSQCTQEWRSSGRRGWSPLIYGTFYGQGGSGQGGPHLAPPIRLTHPRLLR